MRLSKLFWALSISSWGLLQFSRTNWCQSAKENLDSIEKGRLKFFPLLKSHIQGVAGSFKGNIKLGKL